MRTVRVFLLDTGGCGACAAEVWAAVEVSPELDWASGPGEADVVALTGLVPPGTHDVVLGLYRELWAGRVPVVVVGRCAVEGYPFGQGGVRSLGELVVDRKVDSCPPLPSIVAEAVLSAANALGSPRRGG